MISEYIMPGLTEFKDSGQLKEHITQCSACREKLRWAVIIGEELDALERRTMCPDANEMARIVEEHLDDYEEWVDNLDHEEIADRFQITEDGCVVEPEITPDEHVRICRHCREEMRKIIPLIREEGENDFLPVQ